MNPLIEEIRLPWSSLHMIIEVFPTNQKESERTRNEVAIVIPAAIVVTL